MNTIYALTDYKNHFGSKWAAVPYRSGFDKKQLAHYFRKYGFDIEFIPCKNVDFNTEKWRGRIVIYTSSEERGLHYKQFIEDVVFGLHQVGTILLPGYNHIRANNNKVYMEIMQKLHFGYDPMILHSRVYGTFEELEDDVSGNRITYPCVLKKAAGGMSRGVFLAKNKGELINNAKKISRSPNYSGEIKELIRRRIHKGYKPESKYQNRFILQPFIPNLTNDWKVIIFGDHYYILKRGIKKGDFRASGSGVNYRSGREAGFPSQLLDALEQMYNTFNVPHLSLDIAYDGKKGYLLEYQAVYFGTATHTFSKDYFTKKDGQWSTEEKQFDQEEEFVWGIVHYLEKHSELL